MESVQRSQKEGRVNFKKGFGSEENICRTNNFWQTVAEICEASMIFAEMKNVNYFRENDLKKCNCLLIFAKNGHVRMITQKQNLANFCQDLRSCVKFSIGIFANGGKGIFVSTPLT
jgi:hypothetical protein